MENMTEKEFWEFMNEAYKEGRAAQVSARIDSDDPGMQLANRYLRGHSLLPQGYDKFTEVDIIKMSGLLFQKGISIKAKEIILMIFAHQPTRIALNILEDYCLQPDKELEYFAYMALEECENGVDNMYQI